MFGFVYYNLLVAHLRCLDAASQFDLAIASTALTRHFSPAKKSISKLFAANGRAWVIYIEKKMLTAHRLTNRLSSWP